jgi:nitrate/TMAO reductase-like tetraheme cytochrome c subunit
MNDEPDVEKGTQEIPAKKLPSLFRNYISFTGAAIIFASLASIVLLFLIELTGNTNNPYLGIFTWIVLPGFLIFGIVIALVGMLRERRRRRRLSHEEILAFPTLDLNDPHRRRVFLAFIGVGFVFVFMSAFGSYQAYEYTESVEFCGRTCHSVMKPEFTSFQVAPHASLRCVDCHVGAGPEWYVRSKLTGVRQLYGVLFNKYSRPISTPVHNMRAAKDTCGKCHWSQKFFGTQMKEFNRYAYDEQNTFTQTRMLIKTGGGSPATDAVSGIHWHMNLANEVTYISSDNQRQVIPWVRLKDKSGNVTEYIAAGAQVTPEVIEKSPKRVMDCIDCHNRPTHIYLTPDQAMNDAFAAGKLDVTLPYLKRETVTVLSKTYSTNDEALNAISTGLNEFYRVNYPGVFSGKSESLNRAIIETRRIYQTYFFPEMKTDWQAHPDNIGHFYSQGCFRCHDGKHVSNTGKVIRNDCNICHTALDQTRGGTNVPAVDGAFKHPVDLGLLSNRNCDACHKGNRGIQHPIQLGDISQFKCVDCHADKVWSKQAD